MSPANPLGGGVPRALFIDGTWRESTGEATLDVVNPATEQVLATVPLGTVADARAAIAAARRAFDEGPWPRMSPRERGSVLLRMADLLDAAAPTLTELNIAEAGSTRALAGGLQVGIPLAGFRDTVDRVLSSYSFSEPLPPAFGQSGIGSGVVLKEPIGVASLIAAYNFPLLLSLFKLAPALAAGCTTILKPALTTPLEVLALGRIAEEAGLPAGVLNIVTGDVEASQELTTSPLVDMVSFTGSDTVGKLIYAQAAPSLKKVVLELGGKSANVVLEDADLAKAVPSAIGGVITHAGQGCALLTRTLVHESRYEEAVAAMAAALDHITVGDPADPAVMMGPLITEAQRAKVEGLIAEGVREGARLVRGGGRPPGLDTGFYVEPTLFADVDNSMRIAREEFFGPVGVVIPFKDDADAVRLANDSEFGLGGGVWSASPARAFEVARRLRTGSVSLNGGSPTLHLSAPFGGYKHSGIGREWDRYGLEEFLQVKAVTWPVAAG
ncbi:MULTISPECIES: aldehyde dehydrogenase family protein [Streptomyces]|uniref:Aldehyde dehydrogenase family protein n=1 Tax=Streptomyces evansiae TaxID=3075535 RepID=A0ABU2R242_9ACTN|nr:MULTISPECIES: aldehyde dehydrogenase family protein [unclassified Streptomyces]EFL00017.1 betaine aldehyde dehydrogenase [Streptomyces sp. SPB78]MDT0410407.1 aldehyde dehydrogenase family protein [Streptomyces sp. DSM 41979]MYQ57095.1 aldehyde dehydrogenase family protein [Streptomyces sp. SID4926]